MKVGRASLFAGAVYLLLAGCSLSREGTLAPSDGGGHAGGDGGQGATTSGGGETTSSQGGSGAGGGTTSSAENCLDGLDNDGDGQIDCADTDCQPGHECVAEVPVDWTGPYRMRTTIWSDDDVQPCPEGADQLSYMDSPGGPASCQPCSCGSPQGASCNFPTLDCYHNSSSCGGSSDYTGNDQDGTCHSFPGSMTGGNQDDSCRLSPTASLQDAGQCSPTGGNPTFDPTFGNRNDLCPVVGAGGGCGPGAICVPVAEAPYDVEACIVRDGQQPCPGDWPNGFSAFESASDDRGCSSCSCDTPSGVSCSPGSATIYDAGNCGNAGSLPATTTGSCVDVSNHLDNDSGSYRLAAGVPSGGSCAASGGTPSGSVTPTGEVTICCP